MTLILLTHWSPNEMSQGPVFARRRRDIGMISISSQFWSTGGTDGAERRTKEGSQVRVDSVIHSCQNVGHVILMWPFATAGGRSLLFECSSKWLSSHCWQWRHTWFIWQLPQRNRPSAMIPTLTSTPRLKMGGRGFGSYSSPFRSVDITLVIIAIVVVVVVVVVVDVIAIAVTFFFLFLKVGSIKHSFILSFSFFKVCNFPFIFKAKSMKIQFHSTSFSF